MYLDELVKALSERWNGSIFSVDEASKLDPRAKEYLHRLNKIGGVRRVTWGWYCIPEKYEDVFDFFAKDRGFKVLVKQTAASVWNYDFVHRNVYSLAVEDRSYKRALESFGEEMGWILEVESYEKMPYEFEEVDGLFVETPESCLVNCVSDWTFLDAFAVLYFRRDEISLKKVKELARWKRISRTDTRAWTAIKYGCGLFNEKLGGRVFNVRKTSLGGDAKELVEEAVEKVVEFA